MTAVISARCSSTVNSCQSSVVTVTAGATTSNINASLHRTGSISGVLTEATTHAPAFNVKVCILEVEENEALECKRTEANGSYSLGFLLSAIPLMLLLLRAVDPVRWTLAVPIAVLVPLGAWWVLKHVLLIQLPSGVFEIG